MWCDRLLYFVVVCHSPSDLQVEVDQDGLAGGVGPLLSLSVNVRWRRPQRPVWLYGMTRKVPMPDGAPLRIWASVSAIGPRGLVASILSF
jgi:hypothetical protein